MGFLVRLNGSLSSSSSFCCVEQIRSKHVRSNGSWPSQMKVSDLLAVSKEFRSKQTNYIHEEQNLADAVKYLAKNENSSTLVVVDKQHRILGLLTNHLVLDRIAKMRQMKTIPIESTSEQDEWNVKVIDIAIPSKEILHVSPKDSLEEVQIETYEISY
jgi:predicted transcriptional regulator